MNNGCPEKFVALYTKKSALGGVKVKGWGGGELLSRG